MTTIPMPAKDENPNIALYKELLIRKQVNGEEVTPQQIFNCVDINQDHSDLRKWSIQEKITTGKDWSTFLKRKAVEDKIGGVPSTVTEFINFYFKKHNIHLTPKKGVDHEVTLKYQGKDIDEKINNLKEDKRDNSDEIATLNNIKNVLNTPMNIQDLARKLRIISKEVDLNYSAADIEDVLQEKLFNVRPEVLAKIFEKISYSSKKTFFWYNDDKTWIDLADSMFDGSKQLSKLAQIQVVKKFCYQVKRKALNLPISNHAMLMLLGKQGVGKSTFMEKLSEPFSDFTVNTDFQQISDDRNIDIWLNLIMITDEMSYATRTDMNIIKNIITAPTLNRRYMRTNSSTAIRQNATLIGASNRELAQIIRDETGIRRFHAVDFKDNPDHHRLNGIDITRLWASVDEHGEDPIKLVEDEIRVWQEANRVKSSAEQWARNTNYGPNTCTDYKDITFFEAYKEWEKEYSPKKRMDMDEWMLEIHRLAESDITFPFKVRENSVYGKTIEFVYERACNPEPFNKAYMVENSIKYAQMKLDCWVHETNNWTPLFGEHVEYDPWDDEDILEWKEYLTLITNPMVSRDDINDATRISLITSGILDSEEARRKFFPKRLRFKEDPTPITEEEIKNAFENVGHLEGQRLTKQREEQIKELSVLEMISSNKSRQKDIIAKRSTVLTMDDVLKRKIANNFGQEDTMAFVPHGEVIVTKPKEEVVDSSTKESTTGAKKLKDNESLVRSIINRINTGKNSQKPEEGIV